tara:strand:+ start:1851 stop:2165 length:315 start_codon:yes stop_codon:yes gene_type:complete
MMDYYGSVIKSEQEIDKELIQKFRDRCYESHMKKIISDLRGENILHKEYSFAGWLTFHGKTICDIIEKTINHQNHKNEKKLKFTYCFNQLFNDTDVCKMICDRI